MLLLLTRIAIYLPIITMKNLIFLLQPNHIEKYLWKTGKGSVSHGLEIILFLLVVKIYWQAANNGATHIFSLFSPILISVLWFHYNYFIVPNFREGGIAP